ncbi:hypothetical protein F3Y30_08560 [Sinorhizobium sp. BG8]|nr:hypothetical protein F3Y30_08560 [Sinorhizobium sp. BG8]
MVAFAAAPGQVALDGIGDHSPFTKALIGNLAAPGLEVGTAFKRVIRQVRSETKDRQSPQLLSSLVLEFYFGPEKAAIPEEKAPEVIDPVAIEAEADFRKALRINTARTWKQFVAKHRSSEQAVLARQFLQQMQPAGSTITPTAQEKESRFVTSPQKRKEIQIALAAKGITSGTADGAFGSQTRQAITAFQRSVGLPGTGFVNEETADRLGVSLNWREDGIYSSTNARRYDPEDFSGLETDPVVLKALACAPRSPKVFGSFSGHLYIVVQHIMAVHMIADELAKKCGGYLAVITSKAENEFVASLMNGDQSFFHMGFDVSESTGYKMGSWIGLVQDEGGREPRSGWRWQNGQPLAYGNWNSGKPNEHKKGDDFAMYFDERRGQKDMKSVRVLTWDDMGPGDATNSYVVELE